MEFLGIKGNINSNFYFNMFTNFENIKILGFQLQIKKDYVFSIKSHISDYLENCSD